MNFLYVEALGASFSLITDLPPLTGIVRDPNDDMVLVTARAARATYLVTRDRDFLSLKTYEDIRIITPEACMGLLQERGRVE